MEEVKEIKTPKRPEVLRILCILSFIGSGLGLISNLGISIGYDWFVELLHSDKLPKDFEDYKKGMEILFSGGRWFFVLNFLMYVLAVAGIHNMWNLKKIGFHFYTIAQLFLIAFPALFIKNLGIQIEDIFFSGIFVMLYAMNLKIMK